MTETQTSPAASEEADRSDLIKSELGKLTPSTSRRVGEKFFLAALGSIPWVGGFISTMATLKTDAGDIKANDMRTQWLEEHQKKIARLATTLAEISARLERLGDQIHERIQSEEYLDLVRQAFRTWDESDTQEKRQYVATLVANAAGTKLCSDDVIRLFIDWLKLYHEAHFAVIRTVYKNPRVSRYDIWMEIHGEIVREDSAEADLFKLLIRDLSTGGVIRQERETTVDGKFLRKHPRRSHGPAPTTVESAFENSKPYVLTALGSQFVHYSMTDIVRGIEEGKATES
ncbi:MAG: hypothetical protein GXY80_08545 [Syntrophorhabdus aromaticivorans]|uniref:Uncharacterized protein n=1 Tax=Syntrophorhabdus aromaticivorans TaxID=328301 RepID=A0A971M5J4_9BACT|nr:hypothetical protein [Syntrophorhabdus aromaticivorans]